MDTLWEQLSAGGEDGQCGWLKDKFGVSWWIAPSILGVLLQGKDVGKSARVMEAIFKMRKLDIALLAQAYERN
ncbi:VOC family protein [Cupriavidus basilensis]|uniref:VOC family protein n=1 Tax=Cupriavidus basilensis TaxID=68895 RepID=UPI001C2D1DEA